ncbi:hypothetical protein Daus18300_012088 [Diaporthe australafricana]|uniref:Uncharacterized protein n=1 Tax=Diaporthe australafricana TaxID=127596 RepID=A0ABR3W470_9PEZI
MARILAKVKKIFSRPKSLEAASSNASSASSSYDAIENPRPSTATPSYQHAAAVQPPAYRCGPQLQPPATSHSSQAPASFQEQARKIAQFQVGGMRRTRGASSYLTSYESTQTTGTGAASSSAWTRPSYASVDQTTMSSYGQHESDTGAAPPSSSNTGGMDEKKDMHVNGGHHHHPRSTWQGKPNGTAYDRREELTEADEDMWANLAM